MEVTLRWADWPDEFRRSNYLVVKSDSIYKTIGQVVSVSHRQTTTPPYDHPVSLPATIWDCPKSLNRRASCCRGILALFFSAMYNHESSICWQLHHGESICFCVVFVHSSIHSHHYAASWSTRQKRTSRNAGSTSATSCCPTVKTPRYARWPCVIGSYRPPFTVLGLEMKFFFHPLSKIICS